MSLVSLLSYLFLAGGLFFVLVAGIGVLRLPDVYCRSHALGKGMTLGVILLLLGLGFAVDDVAWWKVGAGIVLQLITLPVASHLSALAARRRGVPAWEKKA